MISRKRKFVESSASHQSAVTVFWFQNHGCSDTNGFSTLEIPLSVVCAVEEANSAQIDTKESLQIAMISPKVFWPVHRIEAGNKAVSQDDIANLTRVLKRPSLTFPILWGDLLQSKGNWLLLFINKEKNLLVGASSGSFDAKTREAVVEHVKVTRAFQNQGWCHRMMQDLAAHFLQLGVTKIEMTNAGGEWSLKCYQKAFKKDFDFRCADLKPREQCLFLEFARRVHEEAKNKPPVSCPYAPGASSSRFRRWKHKFIVSLGPTTAIEKQTPVENLEIPLNLLVAVEKSQKQVSQEVIIPIWRDNSRRPFKEFLAEEDPRPFTFGDRLFEIVNATKDEGFQWKQLALHQYIFAITSESDLLSLSQE